MRRDPDVSTIYGKWSYDELDTDEVACVSLSFADPDSGHFSGILCCDEYGDPNEMTIGHLYTHPDLRGQGLATRLVGALAHVAIEQRVMLLAGSCESEHTLKIFQNMFPEEATTLLDEDPLQTSTDFLVLPMSLQQAYGSLERAARSEDDPEHRKHAIDVVADLRYVRRRYLEQPTMRNVLSLDTYQDDF